MTTRRFEVGDRVRVVWASTPEGQQFLGCECTLVGVSPFSGDFETDLPHEAGDATWFGSPKCFAPIYDGNQLSSWSECVWKPTKVKV